MVLLLLCLKRSDHYRRMLNIVPHVYIPEPGAQLFCPHSAGQGPSAKQV